VAPFLSPTKTHRYRYTCCYTTSRQFLAVGIVAALIKL